MAVQASLTIALGRLKPAHLTHPGATFSGEVVTADIGVECVRGDYIAEMPAVEDVADNWPSRARNDFKNKSGHLLVLASKDQ